MNFIAITVKSLLEAYDGMLPYQTGIMMIASNKFGFYKANENKDSLYLKIF